MQPTFSVLLWAVADCATLLPTAGLANEDFPLNVVVLGGSICPAPRVTIKLPPNRRLVVCSPVTLPMTTLALPSRRNNACALRSKNGRHAGSPAGCDYREFRPCLKQDPCGTLIADLFDAHWLPCWQAPRSRRTWSLCLAQSTSAS